MKRLEMSLNIYSVDYLGAYDVKGNFIIRTASPKIKSIDFIPKQEMKQLNKLGLNRFYLKIPEGIIEVFGASIHPSNDPLKNKTKPSGYFFVARLLDTAYIKNLEKITDSEIRFLKNNQTVEFEDHYVFAKIDLKDNSGKTGKSIVFQNKI